MDTYDIRIIARDGGGQSTDDYHATVKRNADGVELIWISDYLWLLKLKLSRWLIDREFKAYDKRQKKLAHEEWLTR